MTAMSFLSVTKNGVGMVIFVFRRMLWSSDRMLWSVDGHWDTDAIWGHDKPKKIRTRRYNKHKYARVYACDKYNVHQNS